MNDGHAVLLRSAERVFGKFCTREVLDDAEKGEWPDDLWDAVKTTGLALAATGEERGGPGGEPGTPYVIVRAAGAHCAPLPLAETLLAEQMLAAAGLPPVDGPATVGPVLKGNRLGLSKHQGRWKLSGMAKRIPWARHAASLVLVADYENQPTTVRVDHPPVETTGWNAAREPRDNVRLDGLLLPAGSVGRPGQGYTTERLYFQGALARTVAIAGVLEKVLELTVSYAKQRVQFGRAIGKFQAIQQQIALMAAHVAASSAAAHAAVASRHRTFEIAAAKARVGEAAGIAAAIAHQVHGAMGFTHEHDLHRYTRRLWAWRDEFGSEAEWSRWIGRATTAMGGEALWPFLTSNDQPACAQLPVF